MVIDRGTLSIVNDMTFIVSFSNICHLIQESFIDCELIKQQFLLRLENI